MRRARMTQLALFTAGEDTPLFTLAPVPVEPESRPTVTPEPPAPVDTWAWAGTLTPADVEEPLP